MNVKATKRLTLFLLALLLTCSSVVQVVAQNALDVAKRHLEQQVKEKKVRLTNADIDGFIVTDQHTSKQSGITHIYARQTYQGIEVFDANMNFGITKDGKVLVMNEQFVFNLKDKIDATSPKLNAKKAIEAAAQSLELEITEKLTVLEKENGKSRVALYSKAGISLEKIPIKLVYQPTSDGRVRLAWDLSILVPDGTNDWWHMRMDAETGELLHKYNWTVHCDWTVENCPEEDNHTNINFAPPAKPQTHAQTHAHQHFHGKHASATPKRALPQPKKVGAAATSLLANTYNVYAMPVESPNHGGRTIETAPWNNALNASPFGWHDDNGTAGAEYTITRGNNVYAQEDQNANDGFGAAPNGGASLDFNFPINLCNAPSSYVDAATTNLFYWNNIMHDVWYQYGFDEASGNFQQNNYGNGGIGGDYVIADCQDGNGTNNANFSSPTDGGNGRMQMFLWTGGGGGVTTFNVNSPAGIAGGYGVAVAQFGSTSGTYTGNLVVVNDGSGAPTEGCGALVNGGAINGNIALVDRGTCQFGDKCLNAQNAGAIAVLVCNNVAGAPINMGPGNNGASVTIPAVMISQADCATIRAQIPTVNVTLTFPACSPTNLDGDLDNGIIAHEYGHGISIRLAGGPSTSGCLTNSEQQGEGWSDWFGLMLTMEPGDLGTDIRGIGTFASSQPINGGGIRTFPYSTDMSINSHTYNSIAGESVPHGVGSVWCAMLWDMTWNLIGQYGWDPDVYNGTGGNNIAMHLVIEGLKLQPCNPGFVDARDAILAADQALYGGANECLIWSAFAGRGLGFGANQGSTNANNDQTESYNLPPSCDGVTVTKTAATTISAGNNLTYTVQIENNTGGTANGVVITDQLPAGTTLVGGTTSCGGSTSGNTLTINVGSMPAGQVVTCTYDIAIPASPFTTATFLDDLESGTANWTVSSGIGTSGWVTSTANPNSGTNAYFVPNVGADNDQYLVLQAPSFAGYAGNPQLRFFHDYDTEGGWDGGMVEISTNGGGTWVDLGNDMTQNGYNSTLGASSNANIANRAAFTGSSGGYIQTIVDLSAYAGQTNAQIRFRFGSDNNTFNTGWYIDDVEFYDAVIVTNNACVNFTGSTSVFCDQISTTVLASACTSVNWYADNDNDGFGNPNNIISACTQPAGYIADNTDCDDTNPTINTAASELCNNIDDNCDGNIDEGIVIPTWYADADNDGFGDPNVSQQSCVQPAGYILDNTDCDDTNAAVNPGAAEACNSADDNCNGMIDEGVVNQTWYADADMDGFGDPNNSTVNCAQPPGFILDNTDCDDTDPTINMAATEICNGIDDDCDGQIDEGILIPTWYADVDADTYGDPNNTIQACTQPPGYVTNNTDCDDTNAAVNPNGTEICNNSDDNCNGSIDEGITIPTWYLDNDADTYGDPNNSIQACTQPAGYVANNLDCNDTNNTINPAGTEICNGIDDNCNGLIDDGITIPTWYADVDADGFGDPNNSTQACTAPPGYVANNTDCDDTSAAINPAASEVCNGGDDNCNGSIDEGITPPTWYADVDADGFGDPNSSIQACTAPSGYVSNNTDCDDSNNAVRPGALELCNGIDDNCNGSIDEGISIPTWYADTDNDTYGDANNTLQACTQPAGYVANSTDCDDTDPNVNPSISELCNGTDDNCNGAIDEGIVIPTWYADTDADTYGDPNNTIQACTQPTGYVANNTDCDDTNPSVNPGASELCNNADDNCNGMIDEGVTTQTWYADTDADAYGDPNNTLVDCAQPAGYVADNTDCDDTNPNVNPMGTEICNNIDDDCSGAIDDVPNICAVTVNLKVYLQGAFDSNTGLMRTDLSVTGSIPSTSPYMNGPWNYFGAPPAATTPTNAVDWIAVEIRDATNYNTILEDAVGFVLNDGTVVDENGNVGLPFNSITAGTAYHVVVRHRNHLDVMTATPLALPTASPIDFTNATMAMGTASTTQLAGALYGLYAGDHDSNGVINVFDYNDYFDSTQGSTIGVYGPTDANLDGNISTADFNLYVPNASRFTLPHLRY